MAGTSLLVLIDDIATLLDDVSLMTKAATKKTAGVSGRRSCPECPTGNRCKTCAGVARGLGGGQRFDAEQGHSSAGRCCHQLFRTLAGYALVDAWWGISVL